jgi:PAS domain S-box-containing protein
MAYDFCLSGGSAEHIFLIIQPMKALSKSDQKVLTLLSEGQSDFEVCQLLGISSGGLAKSLKRIEERAKAESEDAGRYYERALKIRAERQNTSLAARLHALMDVVPHAVLLVDGRTGAIKEFNQLACKLFGYTPAQLSKITIEDLVSPEVRSVHHAYRRGFMSNIRKRAMGYHPPISGVRKDGSLVEIAIGLTATVADDDVMVICTERHNWVSSESESLSHKASIA